MEVDLDVTPEQLEVGDRVFSVTTKETPEGVAFNITTTYRTPQSSPGGDVGIASRGGHSNVVTYKALEMIPPSTHAFLEIITRKPGRNETSEGLPNPPPVTLKKEVRSWQAYFVVSRELMLMPNLYFNFSSEPCLVLLDDKGNPYLGEDGLPIPRPPSFVNYRIRLRDFLKLSKEETDAQTKKLSGTFWTATSGKAGSNWFPRSQTLFGNGLVGETQFRSGAARGADREGNRIADKAVGEGGRLNCQDNGVPKQSLGTRLKGLCINDN
jgi:hypothetical protein